MKGDAMKQRDLQRLYDEAEVRHQQALADHAEAAAAASMAAARPGSVRRVPPPDRELVAVTYQGMPARVATYSGEKPRRYLIRLGMVDGVQQRAIDADNPDYGPSTSFWVLPAELEAAG